MAKKKPVNDNLVKQRVMMAAVALLIAVLIAWFFKAGDGSLDVEGQPIRDASQEVTPDGPTGLPGQNQPPQTPNNATPGQQVPADQIPGMGR